MKKILLVDDSAYMRGILKKILRASGFDVFVEAADGEEALATYARERPDVVLMDIVMPKMSGLDALRAIRRRDPDARVVMVSAIGQDVIVNEAVKAGARGYIVKPFDANNVREAVQAAANGGQAG